MALRQELIDELLHCVRWIPTMILFSQSVLICALVEELEKQDRSGQAEDARREAARERSERMRMAAEELKKIRAGKNSEKEREQARVSLTEPEARNMKHGDNAIAPSYNAQISTDCENKIIVGIHLTQCSSEHFLIEG